MCTINQDHIWFLRYKVKEQSFLSFCHFLPFDPPNNPKNQNFEKISFYTCVPQMTIIWCMVSEISAHQTEFFVILGYFLPFIPPSAPAFPPLTTLIIKILKTGDVILHMSTINKINKNHMMYDSWDMKHNRQNFFALLPLFPTPLTTKRIKIFKKWERLLEISSL